MKTKIKDAIYIAFAVSVALGICAIPIVMFVGCHREQEKYRAKLLSYGLAHPSTYVITYTDKSTDTIMVWCDSKGDWIDMNENSGTFSHGEPYLEYVPYKRYKTNPNYILERKRIYNVLKYKKLQ